MKNKKKLNEYQKKLISKKNSSNFQIPLPLFLLVFGGFIIFLAKEVENYNTFNFMMFGGGVILLLGLMFLYKN